MGTGSIPAAPLQIHLTAKAHGKALKDSPSVWAILLTKELLRSSWFQTVPTLAIAAFGVVNQQMEDPSLAHLLSVHNSALQISK